MDAKRRTYKHMLSEKIKGNERMVEMILRSIESIRNTMSADKDKNYFENRIKNSDASIEKYLSENAALSVKCDGVMTGAYDVEINKLYQDTKEKMLEKEALVAKKDAALVEKEGKNRVQGKQHEDKERGEMRREYNTKRNLDREYNKFLDISETLPDYIGKNLKTMPNNKAYKFRGITFYGELPPENGPIVVFERKPDGMFITEYYADQEVTYFKPRDGSRKEFIRKMRVVRNLNAPATRTMV